MRNPSLQRALDGLRKNAPPILQKRIDALHDPHQFVGIIGIGRIARALQGARRIWRVLPWLHHLGIARIVA